MADSSSSFALDSIYDKCCSILQINFAKSHKKMLICPENETITLANGKLTRNNFKTVGLATLATQRFSANNFQMLKYVTASLKLLSTKLKKAVKESNN